MAIEDGKFANEPDMRIVADAFGRCVGEQFGVSVQLVSFERVGSPEGDQKEDVSA